jgi:hypothetical protein
MARWATRAGFLAGTKSDTTTSDRRSARWRRGRRHRAATVRGEDVLAPVQRRYRRQHLLRDARERSRDLLTVLHSLARYRPQRPAKLVPTHSSEFCTPSRCQQQEPEKSPQKPWTPTSDTLTPATLKAPRPPQRPNSIWTRSGATGSSCRSLADPAIARSPSLPQYNSGNQTRRPHQAGGTYSGDQPAFFFLPPPPIAARQRELTLLWLLCIQAVNC